LVEFVVKHEFELEFGLQALVRSDQGARVAKVGPDRVVHVVIKPEHRGPLRPSPVVSERLKAPVVQHGQSRVARVAPHVLKRVQ
jgi:hypothetical protein